MVPMHKGTKRIILDAKAAFAKESTVGVNKGINPAISGLIPNSFLFYFFTNFRRIHFPFMFPERMYADSGQALTSRV